MGPKQEGDPSGLPTVPRHAQEAPPSSGRGFLVSRGVATAGRPANSSIAPRTPTASGRARLERMTLAALASEGRHRTAPAPHSAHARTRSPSGRPTFSHRRSRTPGLANMSVKSVRISSAGPARAISTEAKSKAYMPALPTTPSATTRCSYAYRSADPDGTQREHPPGGARRLSGW